MCHSPLQHGLRQATHNTLGLGRWSTVSLFRDRPAIGQVPDYPPPVDVPGSHSSLGEPLVYFSFIHSFICSRLPESPKKSPSTYLHTYIGEKYKVAVHGAPCIYKTYIQWGATWFPNRIVNDTAVPTPVPCSLRHNIFYFGLGRPEPGEPACVGQPPSGCGDTHIASLLCSLFSSS